MFILYDLIFSLFSFLYLPYFILKRKYHEDFIQRFGVFPGDIFKNPENHKIIWIHAVSVGEVSASVPLCRLLSRHPGLKIVLSTVTKTGSEFAKKILAKDVCIVYFPLDISFIVRRVIKSINPALVVILETEIWPNFILECKRLGVPLMLINARISDASYGRYKLARPFLKHILHRMNLILAQSEKDARRILSLGAEIDKVKVTGNMKFDNVDLSSEAQRAKGDYADKGADYADKYRSILRLSPDDKLLVAGSTHPGEEEIVLDVYRELLESYPDLKLLIAPRHTERIQEIERLIAKKNFLSLRVSHLNYQLSAINYQPKTIFLLDTIGRLRGFYAAADVVFVGGSLVKRGGHNIIEPAILSKPIISGRYFFNFRDIFRLFLDNQGLLICRNRDEFKEAVLDLLNHPGRAGKLGGKAREVVLKQQGASLKNLECIKNYLR